MKERGLAGLLNSLQWQIARERSHRSMLQSGYLLEMTLEIQETAIRLRQEARQTREQSQRLKQGRFKL